MVNYPALLGLAASLRTGLGPLVAPELEFLLVILLIALVWLAVVTIVIWALSRIRRLF